MASFALTNQVLSLFLKQVGINEKKIGWFMTLTLVGDVIISYFLTWYADTLGRRNVMLLGSLMMAGAGAVFFTCSRFEWLLLAAILGVISPSGDETGPFKSVEEACLATDPRFLLYMDYWQIWVPPSVPSPADLWWKF